MKSIYKPIVSILCVLAVSMSLVSCKKDDTDAQPANKKSYDVSLTYTSTFDGSFKDVYRAPLKIAVRARASGDTELINSFSGQLFINDSLVNTGNDIEQVFDFKKGGVYKLTLKGKSAGEEKEVTKTITILPPFTKFEITKFKFVKTSVFAWRTSINPYIVVYKQKDTIYNGREKYRLNISQKDLPLVFDFKENECPISLDGFNIDVVDKDVSQYAYQLYHTFQPIGNYGYAYGFPDSLKMGTVWNDGAEAYVYFKWTE